VERFLVEGSWCPSAWKSLGCLEGTGQIEQWFGEEWLGDEMAKNIQVKNQTATMGLEGLGPDELKSVIRDGLVGMNMSEREAFFEALDGEMSLFGLDVRKYLVPLGIPGRSPEDLTPTEVGHLVRYLKINVPKAIPAIDKAMARFTVFGEKLGSGGRKLAA